MLDKTFLVKHVCGLKIPEAHDEIGYREEEHEQRSRAEGGGTDENSVVAIPEDESDWVVVPLTPEQTGDSE